MDKQVGNAKVRQSGANNSGDYEWGFKVLARIIARSVIQQQAKSKQGISNKQVDIPPESVS